MTQDGIRHKELRVIRMMGRNRMDLREEDIMRSTRSFVFIST